jgi:hypothetical protein
VSARLCEHGSRCVALAVEGERYCTIHRWRRKVDAVMDPERLRPVETSQVERDADGRPVRFSPKVGR